MVGHANALSEGSVLRQYKTIDVLGMGGFGITYRALDQDLDELVAIKEYLPSDLAQRQGDSTVTARSKFFEKDFEWGLDRFLDEAITLAKFRHGNIVRVKQYFKQNGTGYLVMEYEKGESLEDLLKRSTSLTEIDTKRMLLPILDGLKKVHERDYLHRDIKPANIILRENDGGPVLIDFGAARQAIGPKTRAITAVLTPGYAPLEQYSPDDNQGPWTDIYALGAVAYRCVTGEKPPDATMRVRKDDPLVPASVATKGSISREFADAIDWALRVEETARPQTIDEFITAISFGAGDSTRVMFGQTKVIPKKARPKKTKAKDKPAAEPEDRSKRVTPAATVPETNGASAAPDLSSSATTVITPIPDSATPSRRARSASRKHPPAAASPAAVRASQFPLKRMHLYYAAAAGALLLALFFAVPSFGPGTVVTDDSAWNEAVRANTIPAFQAYVAANPGSDFAPEAQDRIGALQQEVEQAWNRTVTADTVAGYDGFLDQYRLNELHVAEAEEARERARPEEDGWQRATELQTISGYQQYLYAFPTGKHQVDADYAVSVRWPELEAAEDQAGQAALAASAVGACREYLRNYPDGRHIEPCEQKIATAAPPAPAPTAPPPSFVDYQRKLIAIGAYPGPLASVPTNDLIAAITRFQTAGGLTPNGTFDLPTTAAIDDAVRSLESGYAQSKERRTRSDYEAFLRIFPNSSYSEDVKRRIAQCKAEARPGAVSVSPIQQQERVDSVDNPCGAANAKALEQARNACIAKGGEATNVAVLKSEESRPFGSALTGRRTCVATAEAQCQTPGPQIQVEVCP